MSKMSAADRERLLEIRIRSKCGRATTAEENKFVERMFRAHRADYRALEPEVFNAGAASIGSLTRVPARRRA